MLGASFEAQTVENLDFRIANTIERGLCWERDSRAASVLSDETPQVKPTNVK